ncbi:MAG: hypothetical protein C4582_05360 [Desulfobacteraceae bacterium]|nr:MAG: hypothetical protein C4582_05360 [Desulfobacteraceae bacterium]
MEGVNIPYIPTILWLLAAAVTILVLLVMLGYHAYFRRRVVAQLEDAKDVASLAAKKQVLQADADALRQWIRDQKVELDRITVEREEQERLRALLADLESQCARKDNDNQGLRQEVGELENRRHELDMTFQKREKDLSELESKLVEANKKLTNAVNEIEVKRIEGQEIEKRLAGMKTKLEEAQKAIDGLSEAQAKMQALVAEKISLEQAIEGHRSMAERARKEAQDQLEEADKNRREAEKVKSDLESAQKERFELGLALDSLRHKRSEIEMEVSTLLEKTKLLKGEKQKAADEERQAIQETKKVLKETEREKANLSAVIREKQSIEVGIAELISNRTALEKDVKRLEQAKEELDDLKKAVRKSKEELEETAEAVRAFRVEATQAEKDLYETLKNEKRAREETEELRAKKVFLEQEVERLKGDPGGKPSEDPFSDLLKEPPKCLDKKQPPDNQFPYTDEVEALEEARSSLDNAGYHFHKRVLKAFHTSLKCQDINPLTVLAGVSGTGKTLLPAAYAQLMGMHRLIIAVQPRWDSPQDMFGFYNYLEKRYKATELARALVRMDPFTKLEGLDEKERCSERMLLVLLDEMNLARTEYYFSEFLSKLELRRLAGSSASIERRQDAQIYLDTVPGRKAISFWVDRNVLFAGTMNEDESTQTLSDKVIDRANVLRFGRPARLNADDQNHDPLLPPAPGYLTAAIWKRWCRGITTGNWTQKALGWINSLNDALVKIGRPFGHRVEKSILAYISNYPGIEDDGNLLREAFSDQIEQKILPKLRGLDNFESANMTVFQEIAKVIEETEDDVLLKAFHSASASSNTGMFMWYGVTREE